MAVRVMVMGACGRMGSEVVRAVSAESDLELVAAVDPRGNGQDAGKAAGLPACSVPVHLTLQEALAARPDVMVDFTEPGAVMNNALQSVDAGVRPVIGTTGISPENVERLAEAVKSRGISGLVAPNFAIGAVLMIQFAAAASRYLPDCEIIELHHDGKKDAPSGTAIYTAKKIAEQRSRAPRDREDQMVIDGARGGKSHDIPVHSVRLPGFVACQEVILGGPGQTLTLRHDTIDRNCFMPGVILAVREIVNRTGFFLGLESILDF